MALQVDLFILGVAIFTPDLEAYCKQTELLALVA
jgi:hypothetical protein